MRTKRRRLLALRRPRAAVGLAPLACLLVAAAAGAQTQKLEFFTVRREVIEARLKLLAARNEERRANLEKLFVEAGCSGEHLANQPVKRSRAPNVVCTLPGESDAVILVGAHFDFTGRGQGAADNWSGAALLPSLYESVRNVPRRHTFVFVGFTDEEKGLKGSEFYAKQLSPEQRTKMRAMVNLDTMGLSPTKFWQSRADEKLATLLLGLARSMELPLAAVNVERVGSTDSESFRRRKIPTITIHSVTQETYPLLHTSADTLEVVRPDDYYDSYRLIAAYLAYLDKAPE